MSENKDSKNASKEPSNIFLGNEKDSGVGATIGSVIIILIILGGAIYFWEKVKENSNVSREQNEANEVSAEEGLKKENKSDELNDIEEDLKSENFDDIDSEMNAIEAEFKLD